MGLKLSTGRGTRLRHSTGLEWDEMEKAKKKYTPIRHSTGEESKIRHSTGREMDWRALRGEASEGEEEPPQKAALHSIPARAQEDTTYLDLYLKTKRSRASAHHQVAPEDDGEERGEGKRTKEQFKTVDLGY
ncbi:MAG: hypothetical protein ACE5JL_19360 [Dehalococcoidia bacterium]